MGGLDPGEALGEALVPRGAFVRFDGFANHPLLQEIQLPGFRVGLLFRGSEQKSVQARIIPLDQPGDFAQGDFGPPVAPKNPGGRDQSGGGQECGQVRNGEASDRVSGEEKETGGGDGSPAEAQAPQDLIATVIRCDRTELLLNRCQGHRLLCLLYTPALESANEACVGFWENSLL